MASIAVTHTLAAQTSYRGSSDVYCLEIVPMRTSLASHANGIEDAAEAKALEDRHAGWAADMPSNVADFWDFMPDWIRQA